MTRGRWTLVLFPLVSMLCGVANLARAGAGPVSPADPQAANSAARSAFQEKRFGLFVHWGVYALLAKGEWVMEHDKLTIGEYEKVPPRFNPTEFDAETWVRAVKAAGMKYITITAKHHDGFCMYDSALTSYDVVDATPYAKDPMKPLAEACRKHGVTLFFYYSLLDWHHPDYAPLGRTGRHAGRTAQGDWSKYVAYYQGQVRELCTRYGPVGGVWFDGWWDRPDADWDLAGTYKLIHDLQPSAVVGNNHHVAPKPGEDFQMFERDLPGGNTAGFNKAAPDPSVVWEYCETLNKSWGYNASDHAYKSATDVVRLLARSAGHDANLLLNVGPKPDGTIPKEALERLAQVGRWLETHGASIHGTRQGPVKPSDWGVSTVSEKPGEPRRIYLHYLDPSHPLKLPASAVSFDARVLGGSRPLKVETSGGNVVVEVPEADRDPADTVIVLTPKVLEPERKSRRR